LVKENTLGLTNVGDELGRFILFQSSLLLPKFTNLHTIKPRTFLKQMEENERNAK
jgi:hypothetical protein